MTIIEQRPVQPWAVRSTAERVASLREEAERAGEDVSGLSDADLLNRVLTRSLLESRRHENNYTALLQDRAQHDRAVYAAARREASEDRRAWAGMYLSHLVARNAGAINEVINRAANLPDGKAPLEQTRELKAAADRAKWMMSGLVGHTEGQLDEARRQSTEIRLVEKQRAEILRLREFITAQGRRLHDEHGASAPRGRDHRCQCPGCELIRSMDDTAKGPDGQG